MRVLQFIDSLEAGGAEQVAVNLANGLVPEIDKSYLCTTRKEGVLKNQINKNVEYLFLNKKSTLDFKAIIRVFQYVKKNEISFIHAHASSFFLATLIKILNPKLILVWHDHYGESDFLDQRPKRILKLCSSFFNHVFCVNTKLKSWVEQELKVTSVSYLPNFATVKNTVQETQLNGITGKRIVCLANLRPQKDHLNLLKAFKLLIKIEPDWSLHLIGKNFEDDYSKSVFQFIKKEKLTKQVCFYGTCRDVSAVLKQSDIGVLASKSEGLPLALLEYGLAGLPVVVTHVGDCSKVIENKGLGMLVSPENEKALYNGLLEIIKNRDKSVLMGQALKKHVESHFSEAYIIPQILTVYKAISRY